MSNQLPRLAAHCQPHQTADQDGQEETDPLPLRSRRGSAPGAGGQDVANPEYTNVDPAELKELEDSFYEAGVKQLDKVCERVEVPGPGSGLGERPSWMLNRSIGRKTSRASSFSRW